MVGGPNGLGLLIGLLLLLQVAAHAYTILMLASFGQTVGKMAAGIVVVRASDLSAIGLREAFLRSVGEIALQLFGCFMLAVVAVGGGDSRAFDAANLITNVVGLVWFLAKLITMLTNERRRAVLDFIAGTVVVKKDYLERPSLPFPPPAPANSGW